MDLKLNYLLLTLMSDDNLTLNTIVLAYKAKYISPQQQYF